MDMSHAWRLPRELHFGRSSSNVPRLPLLLRLRQNAHVWLTVQNSLRKTRLERPKAVLFLLGNMLHATTACTFWVAQLPKVLRPWDVLNILASKCVSLHKAVHFFNISTSKSAAGLVCYAPFELQKHCVWDALLSSFFIVSDSSHLLTSKRPSITSYSKRLKDQTTHPGLI